MGSAARRISLESVDASAPLSISRWRDEDKSHLRDHTATSSVRRDIDKHVGIINALDVVFALHGLSDEICDGLRAKRLEQLAAIENATGKKWKRAVHLTMGDDGPPFRVGPIKFYGNDGAEITSHGAVSDGDHITVVPESSRWSPHRSSKWRPHRVTFDGTVGFMPFFDDEGPSAIIEFESGKIFVLTNSYGIRRAPRLSQDDM